MRIAAIAARPAVLALLLAASGCAAVPPAVGPAGALPVAGTGIILAVRPIALAVATDGAAWRASLLDGAADSGGPPPGATRAEFIVRDDSGATLSVVQPIASSLRPGDRVTVNRAGASAGRASIGPLL